MRKPAALGHARPGKGEVQAGERFDELGGQEDRGWIKCKTDPGSGLRARRKYSPTENGRKVLAHLRAQIEELHREIVLGEDGGRYGQ